MASAPQPASNKTRTGTASNFGGSAINANREPLGKSSWFQTQDATPTTALVSPVTLGTVAATTIVIPNNAVSITVIPSAAVQVTELNATVPQTQFVTLPANVPVTIEVAKQQYLYFLAPTGTPTVSFFFQTI